MMSEQVPRRLAPDRLLVPMRAETDGVVGDGAVEIGPEDPDYQQWAEFLEHQDDPVTD
jgi:hypothetical protein